MTSTSFPGSRRNGGGVFADSGPKKVGVSQLPTGVVIDAAGSPKGINSTGVADGDVLIYDAGTGKWIPGTAIVASGGVVTLNRRMLVDTSGDGTVVPLTIKGRKTSSAAILSLQNSAGAPVFDFESSQSGANIAPGIAWYATGGDGSGPGGAAWNTQIDIAASVGYRDLVLAAAYKDGTDHDFIFCNYGALGASATDGGTTSGQPTVTSPTLFGTTAYLGCYITGPNIPTPAYIKSINTGTHTATLDGVNGAAVNATGNGSGLAFQVFGFPVTLDIAGQNTGNMLTINPPSAGGSNVHDPAMLVLIPPQGQYKPAFAIKNGLGAPNAAYGAEQIDFYASGVAKFQASVPANDTATDGVTNTDTTLVSATLFAPWDPVAGVLGQRAAGRFVQGTGIPTGTWIKTVNTATNTATLSNATTATASGVSISVLATSFRLQDNVVNPWISLCNDGTHGNVLVLSPSNCVSVGPGATPAETNTLGVRAAGTNAAVLFVTGSNAGAARSPLKITSLATANEVDIATNDASALMLGTSGTGAVRIDGNQNLILGTGAKATPAELATNATNGFAYLPTVNGTPSGTPASLPTGATPFVIDRSGSKLWAYVGGAWKGVAIA